MNWAHLLFITACACFGVSGLMNIVCEKPISERNLLHQILWLVLACFFLLVSHIVQTKIP